MKIFFYLITLLSLVIFTGCSGNKLLSIDKKFKNKEIYEIEKSILKASEKQNWEIKKMENGLIILSLSLRNKKHLAQITYNKNSYSIKCIDSTDLKKNIWIKNLSAMIDNYIKDLKLTKELKEMDKQLSYINKESLILNRRNINKKVMDIKRVINKKDIKNVEEAIFLAADSEGWKLNKEKEGLILGRYASYNYSMTSKIQYSAQEYKISYLSSDNLSFDKNTYSIDKKYNGNIWDLKKEINTRLIFID